MKTKRFQLAACLTAAVLLLPIISLTSCHEGDDVPADSTGVPDTSVTSPADSSANTPESDPIVDIDTDAGQSTISPVVTLTFNGHAVSPSVSDSGIRPEGNAFIITKAGTYKLTGNLEGQLRVSVPKTEKITLIFHNFKAINTKSAPVYIESANKVSIELDSGTVNELTDAEVYLYEDPTVSKPNACLYSSEDITIEGSGELIVNARYNNGIGTKNDLKIKSGKITVKAPHNILKGNDSVTIEGGTLNLQGGNDAMKADVTTKPDKGFVLVQSGANIQIDCVGDAIQATLHAIVEQGAVIHGTAGNPVNCPGQVTVDEQALSGLKIVPGM